MLCGLSASASHLRMAQNTTAVKKDERAYTSPSTALNQKESLQEKLDAYKPVKKEEIIPWMGVENELEKLYVDLGQWRQTL